jgi:hypothetical protein
MTTVKNIIIYIQAFSPHIYREIDLYHCTFFILNGLTYAASHSVLLVNFTLESILLNKIMLIS